MRRGLLGLVLLAGCGSVCGEPVLKSVVPLSLVSDRVYLGEDGTAWLLGMVGPDNRLVGYDAAGGLDAESARERAITKVSCALPRPATTG